MRKGWNAVGAIGVSVLLLAGCGDDADDATASPGETTGETVETDEAAPAREDGVFEVPGEFASIQGAVDAAAPGDLILISPGVYEEAVVVETDELTIRGLDRDETILEGNFERDNGILVAGASGVAIENLTAQNYASNGFYWTGVTGFRGSYLTAIRNGDYGIYAFESTDGIWEHSYASGSPDAGFYVGACYPCRVVIDDVISEWNGLGYSGTNAGGDLYIINSVWRFNRAGVVPNVGTYEPCFPQREATIVGNYVHDNNNGENDAIDAAQLALGNGILMPGGLGNVVERNLVENHDITGIGIVPQPEDDPVPITSDDIGGCVEDRIPDGLVDVPEDQLPDSVLWPAQDNRVVGNVVRGSGLADLGLADLGLSPTPDGGNCFSDNEVTITAPLRLQELVPCGAAPATAGYDEGALDVGALIARDKPPVVPYQEVALPDPVEQPEMPDAATAPARPQTGPPTFPDLAAIAVPTPR